MTVLVIGRTGQISRCLQARQIEAIYLNRDELELERTSDIAGIIQSNEPEFIINTAAYTAVDRAEEERELAMAINVDAVGEIARVAKSKCVPMVHYSTDYVFSGDTVTEYVETDETGPLNVYGHSKLAGEKAIQEIAPANYWIIRTSWVFSEFGNNFVKTMLKLGRQEQCLEIVTDQSGRPTYAGDLADVTIHLLNRWRSGKSLPSGIYHWASTGVVNWAQFAKIIFEQAVEANLIETEPSVVEILSEQYPAPAIRPHSSVLCTHKLEAALNVTPVPWELGVRKVLDATTTASVG